VNTEPKSNLPILIYLHGFRKELTTLPLTATGVFLFREEGGDGKLPDAFFKLLSLNVLSSLPFTYEKFPKLFDTFFQTGLKIKIFSNSCMVRTQKAILSVYRQSN